MKSKQVDLRTQYCTMIFKRSGQEQILIRQEVVRYAQRYGIKTAAKHYGCSKNTVRTWVRHFKKRGTGALENKSRAPHFCPHKTPKEIEDQVIAKRKKPPCHGPRSLKYYNPSLKLSTGAIYRILKEKGLLRKHRKKYRAISKMKCNEPKKMNRQN